MTSEHSWLSPPCDPAQPTLSHRVPWRFKEFILKWNGNWKKLFFSYGKNLITHLFLLISVHDSSPECFLQPICSWSYKTDLSFWSDFPRPCAFVLLKPFSTFVNLSDNEKNYRSINVESWNPWDVPQSFNGGGLFPSQMFSFSRYHCVLKLWIIIAL